MSTEISSSHGTLERRLPWFLLAAAFSAITWMTIVVPAFQLLFASDEYSLLVEDQRNPWYRSLDHVYRPLRNGLFRIMPSLFGLNPFPYHLMALTWFVAALAVWYVFLRKLGAEVHGAIAAVAILAVYPRNGPFLFGFVWGQEVVTAVGMLVAIVGWIQFRRQGSWLSYAISCVAFALAIGFKETAAVLPALVLLVDLYLNPEELRGAMRRKSFLLPYVGLVLVLIVFAGFVLSDRSGALLAPNPRSGYKFDSLSGAALAEMRTVANLLMPFGELLGLRDLAPWHYALLASEIAGIAILARFTRTGRAWLFALLWTLVVSLPPGLFARSVNSERYLFLPMLGIGLAIALTVDALLRYRWAAPAIALVLVFYAVLSGRELRALRTEWRESGEMVQSFVRATVAAAPPREVQFLHMINVPSAHGHVSVLNNGLRGALQTAGYPDGVKLQIVHAGQANSPEEELVSQILRCPAGAGRKASHRDLVWLNDQMVDRTGSCTDALIEADRQRRPWAWLDL